MPDCTKCPVCWGPAFESDLCGGCRVEIAIARLDAQSREERDIMQAAGIECFTCKTTISPTQSRRFEGRCPRCHIRRKDDLAAEAEKLTKRLIDIQNARARLAAAEVDQTPLRFTCVCECVFDSYIALAGHVGENGDGHREKPRVVAGLPRPFNTAPTAKKAPSAPKPPNLAGIF